MSVWSASRKNDFPYLLKKLLHELKKAIYIKGITMEEIEHPIADPNNDLFIGYTKGLVNAFSGEIGIELLGEMTRQSKVFSSLDYSGYSEPRKRELEQSAYTFSESVKNTNKIMVDIEECLSTENISNMKNINQLKNEAVFRLYRCMEQKSVEF